MPVLQIDKEHYFEQLGQSKSSCGWLTSVLSKLLRDIIACSRLPNYWTHIKNHFFTHFSCFLSFIWFVGPHERHNAIEIVFSISVFNILKDVVVRNWFARFRIETFITKDFYHQPVNYAGVGKITSMADTNPHLRADDVKISSINHREELYACFANKTNTWVHMK